MFRTARLPFGVVGLSVQRAKKRIIRIRKKESHLSLDYPHFDHAPASFAALILLFVFPEPCFLKCPFQKLSVALLWTPGTPYPSSSHAGRLRHVQKTLPLFSRRKALFPELRQDFIPPAARDELGRFLQVSRSLPSIALTVLIRVC
jgi:hypothetical protein